MLLTGGCRPLLLSVNKPPWPAFTWPVVRHPWPTVDRPLKPAANNHPGPAVNQQTTLAIHVNLTQKCFMQREHSRLSEERAHLGASCRQ